MASVALLLVVGQTSSDEACSIFGTVTGQDGAPISGVTLSFDGELPSHTTDENGAYHVAGAKAGETYTIVPAQAGMSFSPASRTVTMDSGDEIVDFRAQAAGGGIIWNSPPSGATYKSPPPPDITVPAGGETWQQGSAYKIEWSGGATDPVTLSIERPGGPGVLIAMSTANDGSFWWKVPASIPARDDYRIHISGEYGDNFSAEFSIAAVPLVTYPNNAGVSWRRGQPYKIQWQGFGGSHVKIQLYRAGSLNRLISWSTPNDGAFWWKVPATQATGTTFKIKITGQSKAVVYDFSDKNFVIAGEQTVTWPTISGMYWPQGWTNTIKWQGYVGQYVRIELLRNWSLAKVIAAVTPNDGSFVWKMPWTVAWGMDYRVRVISVNDPTQRDHSNNNFAVSPVARVIYPNAGGTWWVKGQAYTIKWSGFVESDVKITLLNSGVPYRQITASTPNDGRFVWSVPMDVPTGNNYRILVGTPSKALPKIPMAEDSSDNPFTIAGPPKVTFPNEETYMIEGQNYQIKWTNFRGTTVKIELLDFGVPVEVLSPGTANDGMFVWQAQKPKIILNSYRIRITSVQYPSFTDTSDEHFEIGS